MQETTIMMSNIKYGDAELYVVHCFDPRSLWLRIWQKVCPNGVLIGRLPLAGASARGKHYVSYYKKRQADQLAPIIFVTHFPCGWFEGQDESVILKHGEEVVDTLVRAGFMAIHIHFSLSKQSWKMARRVYDPCDLTQSESLISSILERTATFEKQVYSENDLVLEDRIELLVIAEEVYGPPQGGSTLVASGEMIPYDALCIIGRLNGDKEPVPIPVLPTPRYYVPNY